VIDFSLSIRIMFIVSPMVKKTAKFSVLLAIVIFAFGGWCSHLASFGMPALTIQPGEVEMGCAAGSASKVALAPALREGVLKSGKLQAIALFSPTVSANIFLSQQETGAVFSVSVRPKTPLHLFHAVLTL
jgi:hypothetical protein